MDVLHTVDVITGWVVSLKDLAPPGYVPAPTWAAVGLLGVGAILCWWGSSLLKAIYVLGFMALGGTIGIGQADRFQIDQLIGLVLGAGLAGLICHLMFRWWVGISAGACAALVVFALGWSGTVPQELAGFKSQQQPLQESEWLGALRPAEEMPSSLEVEELRQYLWKERPELVTKVGIVCGLAFVLGLTFGIALPRLTIVAGTSLFGLAALILGAGTLISVYRPDWWSAVDAHPSWFLAGIAGMWVVSMMAQVNRRAPITAAPANAAPAAAV